MRGEHGEWAGLRRATNKGRHQFSQVIALAFLETNGNPLEDASGCFGSKWQPHRAQPASRQYKERARWTKSIGRKAFYLVNVTNYRVLNLEPRNKHAVRTMHSAPNLEVCVLRRTQKCAPNFAGQGSGTMQWN